VSEPKIQNKRLLGHIDDRMIRDLTFFVLFYLYLWLEVKLCFLFHGAGITINFPVFYKTWDFFLPFLEYPGGLAAYLAAFFAQFFYYSWSGAIVVTIQAWLLCACFDSIIKNLNIAKLRFIRFVPAILMLVIYNQYEYQFDNVLGILLALAFMCVYQKITFRSSLSSFAGFLILSIILYTVAGGAYLIFASICIIQELLFKRQAAMSFLFIFAAAIIPLIEGFFIFGVSIDDSYLALTPFSSYSRMLTGKIDNLAEVSTFVLYQSIPFIILLAGIFQLVSGTSGRTVRKKQKAEPRKKKFLWYTGRPILKWSVESGLLLLITSFVTLLSYDRELKGLFATDYYAYHKQWRQVLKHAPKKSQVFYITHFVNRALYHTGRLAYEMFSYPQHTNVLFLDVKPLSFWKKFDFFIETGMINVAENCLAESLGRLEDNPAILKRMALVKMVKGDIPAARVYLGALSKTIPFDDWADDYLRKLDTDSELSEDAYIQYLRSIKTDIDSVTNLFNKQEILANLLKENPHNKAAFEYYMAQLLLTWRWDEFIANIYRLRELGYTEIPTHYQEAILIYSARTGRVPDLHGYKIDTDIKEKFRAIDRLLLRYSVKDKIIFDTLAANHGNSCFFYSIYKQSGMEK